MKTARYCIVLILMTLYFSSLGQKMTIINGKDTIDVTDQYYYKDTNLLYFPMQIMIDTINVFNQEKDSLFYIRRLNSALLENSWFTKQLTGLKEPRLHKKFDLEVYRFTWLRSFHNPISIRVEMHGKTHILIVKRADGTGGYNPGQLKVADTINITEYQWNILKNKIYNLNFWKIPTIEKSDFIVMDGAMWIFEAKRNNRYHMVFRQSGKGTEIKELCMYLLELSKLKIKKREIY